MLTGCSAEGCEADPGVWFAALFACSTYVWGELRLMWRFGDDNQLTASILLPNEVRYLVLVETQISCVLRAVSPEPENSGHCFRNVYPPSIHLAPLLDDQAQELIHGLQLDGLSLATV
ncbi:hypothetical protein K438DRAFT_1934769 [Mycena galopus ATCC 62051]|nr:hypothetical protein K438DRAFT_1934769 [Mycena galopus ATCC 62051]